MQDGFSTLCFMLQASFVIFRYSLLLVSQFWSSASLWNPKISEKKEGHLGIGGPCEWPLLPVSADVWAKFGPCSAENSFVHFFNYQKAENYLFCLNFCVTSKVVNQILLHSLQCLVSIKISKSLNMLCVSWKIP